MTALTRLTSTAVATVAKPTRRKRALVVASVRPLNPRTIHRLDAMRDLGVPLRVTWDGHALTITAADDA